MVAYVRKEKPDEDKEFTFRAVAEIKRKIIFNERPVPILGDGKKIRPND
jgi:hypothetical protein